MEESPVTRHTTLSRLDSSERCVSWGGVSESERCPSSCSLTTDTSSSSSSCEPQWPLTEWSRNTESPHSRTVTTTVVNSTSSSTKPEADSPTTTIRPASRHCRNTANTADTINRSQPGFRRTSESHPLTHSLSLGLIYLAIIILFPEMMADGVLAQCSV